MIKPIVVNIVASASTGLKFDLVEIREMLDGANYDKNRFPGLIYRMKRPKVAILLFTSGKLVCTGAKSPEQTREAIHILLDRLKVIFKERHPDKIKDFPETVDINIQNIVATGDLHTVLNLNKIVCSLPFEKVEYEPEQFPGMVYRVEEPPAVLLLFGSGKVVCTGAKHIEDIQKAINVIVKELESAGFIHN